MISNVVIIITAAINHQSLLISIYLFSIHHLLMCLSALWVMRGSVDMQMQTQTQKEMLCVLVPGVFYLFKLMQIVMQICLTAEKCLGKAALTYIQTQESYMSSSLSNVNVTCVIVFICSASYYILL